MKIRKSVLAVAVLGAIGAGGGAQPASAASIIAAGNYNMVIIPTPITTATTTYGSATYFSFGKDGAWNSSFTFDTYTTPPIQAGSSFGMTDNSIADATDGGPRGSSVGGDGYAGDIGLTVNGSGAFTVNRFSVDAIPNTYGGNLVQYTDPTKGSGPDTAGTGSMGGSVDGSGNMTFDPTGRLGAFSLLPSIYDAPLNVNPGGTLWQPFSTGSATDGTSTIHGAAVHAIGDVNGDGRTDYAAILVSGGQFGSPVWGSFQNGAYLEVWNVQFLSAPVPIPATAWLFGSGLLGLLGLAKRAKSAAV